MSDSTLAEWFALHKGQYVDVVIAGRVFGGRYAESPQLVRHYDLTDVTLVFRFGSTEVLTVVSPCACKLGEHGRLIVPRAAEAVFGWHYYGRPRTAENWCEERYLLVNDQVEFTRTGPLLPEERFFNYSGDRFVELV